MANGYKNSAVLAHIDELMSDFQQFCDQVASIFRGHPSLQKGELPPVHSVKNRLKSWDSLDDKIERKKNKGTSVDGDNVFDEITDIAGVRVFHIHTKQFEDIYGVIKEWIDKERWLLYEKPVAYTWDPDLRAFFEGFDIRGQQKDIYTSVHFVLVDPTDPRVKCEVQVRTLFDEIWAEIDHTLNYPYQTESLHCYEQLRVLARLTTTGTRLNDSIIKSFRSGE